ncbi:hypothetical protein [Bradyrhizobium sp. DOA9]|uniref:hypothetical protein n=1 Tax=Bradyrhizobium sp. DOA9 TaxID=1126627 RepID=UPI00046A7E91|nr:hypothetical protein [Bradyrhizobium sp. DOA9]GAJ31395.1 hypothetical protein BDOA9_0105740 [Bradyrhizobium sp. DOA9]
MYFLTVCLIVLALSALVSSRRAGLLPRTPRGRFAAIWPGFGAGIVALGLIGFERAQGGQEAGPSVTNDLLMLIAAFFAGWFIGVLGEWEWR